MSVSFDEYPKNFFGTNMFLLKFAGMWYPEKDLPSFKRFAFIAWIIAMILYNQIIYTPLEIVYLSKTYKNLDQLIEQVGVILTHLLGVVKIVVWFYNRKKIENMMALLHDDKYKYESHESFRPSQIFESNRKVSMVLSFVFTSLAQGVSLSKILATTDIYRVDEETFRNTTCFPFLPYYSLVPFDTSTRSRCIGALLFQAYSVWFYAVQISAFDVLFAAILNCIKTHFLILQGAFTTIRPRCLKRLGLKEKDVLNDDDVPALEREMYLEMKKSTIHLQKLIELREEFENVFTFVTLGQVLVTLFAVVTCLFMLSTLPLFSGDAAAQIEYFTALMVQFTLYSWFGNEITLAVNECFGLLFALYEGDWLFSSVRFKKFMLINMERIKKPYYITIGKFTPLTLSTFVFIIRGSYSYYAVLSKQKEDLNG